MRFAVRLVKIVRVVATIALVLFGLRLRCIGSKDVATFMKQHPEWASHPIDAKPFHWDPASGTLGVLPVGHAPEEVRLSLQQVGFAHCPRI